jgi:hypothetical protein
VTWITSRLIYLWLRTPGNHWIEGLVGRIAGLDIL